MVAPNDQEMVEELPEAQEDEIDEEPVFVGADEAVEVQVDEDAPMDDDDDDDDEEADEDGEEETKEEVEDMSKFKLESHTGPVYGISCHFDVATQKLTILSGGGDDRAFLASSVQGAAPTTFALEHAHTDSVSAVALNLDYVSEDLSKTPRMAVVGAYDGGTSNIRRLRLLRTMGYLI